MSDATVDNSPDINEESVNQRSGSAEAVLKETDVEGDESEDLSESVAISEPAKLMRIGTMIRALLNEIHHAPLDEAGRDLMHDIYQKSVGELAQAMAEPLREELERLTLPFSSEVPSEAELRLAQAQLVGWLEGLFHGIQAAVAAQRETAEQQLKQMLNSSSDDQSEDESIRLERGGVYL